jgi:hypothetical protein
MKLLSAVLDKEKGDLTLTVWVDEDALLDDGAPDPSAIRVFTYGAGPRGPSETKNAHERRLDDHARSSLRELRLLVKEDQRRARKAEDRAADPAEPEVVALIAEPIDLDAATLEVKV